MVNARPATKELPAIQRIHEPAQFKALAHPIRVRLLRILLVRTATVEQLADELGEPSGRVHYHVRILERHGLIDRVKTRQKLGVVEKYYHAVASAFQIEGIHADTPTALATFLGLWREAEQRVAHFVATTDRRPEKRPTDLFLFEQVHLTPQRAAHLIVELQQVIARFSGPTSTSERNYHIVVAIHPLLRTYESASSASQKSDKRR
jgi:DNA-binding transcriptional ArsR family regulator